jgi:sulfate adenylyltransferase (ADP) / ATP adenylyltransferase
MRAMAPCPERLVPGTLSAALERAARHALASGAMEPIETEEEELEDGGMRFLVRSVSSLARKRLERRRRKAKTQPDDPFLPYEQDLFVARVSSTHDALLNKYNVIDRHMLIVTRRFVHQEALLDRADLAALAACVAEFESLGFYNGGAVAGASQPHKHLQMVPVPLGTGAHPLPIEAVLGHVAHRHGILIVPGLPFRHAFSWVDRVWEEDAFRTADRLMSHYRALLAAVGITAVAAGGEARQSGPYNLLVTRRWMLAVPRLQEHFAGVSVNALGFAGTLFVQDDARRAALARSGPMAALCAVAGARESPA